MNQRRQLRRKAVYDEIIKDLKFPVTCNTCLTSYVNLQDLFNQTKSEGTQPFSEEIPIYHSRTCLGNRGTCHSSLAIVLEGGSIPLKDRTDFYTLLRRISTRTGKSDEEILTALEKDFERYVAEAPRKS